MDEGTDSVTIATPAAGGSALSLNMTPSSEGYEVTESSFHQQQADPLVLPPNSAIDSREKMTAEVGASADVPSLAMTATSSTDNLQMVASSASSLVSLSRIRNDFDLPDVTGADERGRVPWFLNALPRPSTSQQSSRKSDGECSSKSAAGVRSLVDVFSVVTNNFFQDIACTHPASFGRGGVPPSANAGSSEMSSKSNDKQDDHSHQRPTIWPHQQARQQRDDLPSDDAEEIEFDETEILRRDYELSRV